MVGSRKAARVMVTRRRYNVTGGGLPFIAVR
jgi:hypothetical protein